MYVVCLFTSVFLAVSTNGEGDNHIIDFMHAGSQSVLYRPTCEVYVGYDANGLIITRGKAITIEQYNRSPHTRMSTGCIIH